MRAYVLGVKRVSGVAKTGNDFDMCRVLVATPISPVRGDRISVEGFGHEVNEIALEPAALVKFKGVKLPAMLELEVDSRAFRGKLEPVVIGFHEAEKAA